MLKKETKLKELLVFDKETKLKELLEAGVKVYDPPENPNLEDKDTFNMWLAQNLASFVMGFDKMEYILSKKNISIEEVKYHLTNANEIDEKNRFKKNTRYVEKFGTLISSDGIVDELPNDIYLIMLANENEEVKGMFKKSTRRPLIWNEWDAMLFQYNHFFKQNHYEKFASFAIDFITFYEKEFPNLKRYKSLRPLPSLDDSEDFHKRVRRNLRKRTGKDEERAFSFLREEAVIRNFGSFIKRDEAKKFIADYRSSKKRTIPLYMFEILRLDKISEDYKLEMEYIYFYSPFRRLVEA